MVILGIDPGFSFTGYGIIKKEGQKVTILDCGYLQMSSSKPLYERVAIFHATFTKKIEEYHVDTIALETPFLGKNAQNFLKLGYLRGIVYLLVETHKTELFEFSPREIKQAVTGFGGAQKEQVARTILRLFPMLAAPHKADVTDALAVTLCCLWSKK